MPTASDLVTDLPADFETFGQAVATSMADLLGGTTGQVLSKASNTDMDFTWAAPASIGSAQSFVSTQQGTTSLTYTGLTTAQSVTLTTGTKVMVIVGANLQTINAEERAFMSYAISGATTSASSDSYAVAVCSSTAYDTDQQSYVSYRTVTAGSNTFTAQFRTAGSTTMEAGNRTLIVIDLGS
jgi:hypothetical protein